MIKTQISKSLPTKKLRELLEINDKKVHGILILNDDRCRISAALYNISLQHVESIALLVEAKCFSSASALVRPMLEAHVRAAWIFNCAAESMFQDSIQVSAFSKKKISAMLNELVKLRKLDGNLVGIVNEMSILHDYTHGGMLIVSRNITETEIATAFEGFEMTDMLSFVSKVALASYNGISILAKCANGKAAHIPRETRNKYLRE